MPERTPRRRREERPALLQAVREVMAEDGAHASVAAIAARAGVGIGSLDRRYATKEVLIEHLALLTLDAWDADAERVLAEPDAWAGLSGFVVDRVEDGQGALAPLAGTLTVTPAMAERSERGDRLLADLVSRAHEQGALRPEVTAVDVTLLIEQVGRSHLLEQGRRRGLRHLVADAESARRRVVAIAVDGARTGAPLPGAAPSPSLFAGRWEHDGPPTPERGG